MTSDLNTDTSHSHMPLHTCADTHIAKPKDKSTAISNREAAVRLLLFFAGYSGHVHCEDREMSVSVFRKCYQGAGKSKPLVVEEGLKGGLAWEREDLREPER